MSKNDDYDVEAEIDQLRGTAEQKKQAKILLRVLSGTLLPRQACSELGIQEAELEQLKLNFVGGALRGLLPPSAPRRN